MDESARCRIVLLLTDGQFPRKLPPLGPSDIVLTLGDFARAGVDVRKVGAPSVSLQKQAAEGLVRAIEGMGDQVRPEILAFANDVYSYTFRPIVAVAEAVLAALAARPEATLTIVHAERKSTLIPMLGFATNESPRGSRLLLGSYIASHLKRQPEIANRAKFVSVRRDLLCVEPVRSLAVRILDLVMRLGFLWKMACLRFLVREHPLDDDRGGPIFIVRASHQARFAERIGFALQEKGWCARVLVLPQFTQGSIRSTLRELGGRFGVVTATLRQAYEAVSHASKDAKRLRGGCENSIIVPIAFGDRRLDFKLDGLCTEIGRLKAFLVYRRLLASVLHDAKADRAINFELVGRIAGLDRISADEAGCRLCTVQTAVVSAVPHPIFPISHIFYADGPCTAESLADIGAKRLGDVLYAGSTLPLLPMKPLTAVTEFAFFTQPYEPDVTSAIIETLAQQCRENQGVLRIKLHPRDDSSRYRDALSRCGDVAELCGSSNSPLDVILRSELCVTRTSSVAKEALAYGRPVVLCLWSELDRTIRADYADPAFPGHLAYDKAALAALIKNPSRLYTSAEPVRQHMFGHCGIDDLAVSIFNG